VDIDIWIDPSPENAERVWAALAAFGAPMEDLGIRVQDLTRKDVVVQFGLPPNRIDILTGVSGLSFDEAWGRHVEAPVEGVRVPVIGRDALLKNKRASGRDKDRGDANGLEGRG
jgi:hypothetical protein